MTKFTEITSVDPLNLALTAPSRKLRAFWGAITVLATMSLIFLTVLLVIKYNKEPRMVVTKLKSSRVPFPAVTFCNLNPYKKSALLHIPEVAELLRVYNNISRNLGNGDEPPVDDEMHIGIRNKRASACDCDIKSQKPSSSSVHIFTSSHFTLCESRLPTYFAWDCAFTCCSKISKQGYKSRLAKLDNSDVINLLRNEGLLIDQFTWIGLFRYSAGQYHWCDAPTTCWSDSVNISKLCDICTEGLLGPSQGQSGGVNVNLQSPTELGFSIGPPVTTRILCEDYIDEPTNTGVTTTEATTSQNLALPAPAPLPPKPAYVYTESCSCQTINNTQAQDKNISQSVYERLDFRNEANISWECGFQCCDRRKPDGMRSRLAKIDNERLVDFLLNKGFIPSGYGYYSRIGLVREENGVFRWYDDPGTPSSDSAFVNISCICPRCLFARAGFDIKVGGLFLTTGYPNFYFQDYIHGTVDTVICEYYQPGSVSVAASSATCGFSTTAATSTPGPFSEAASLSSQEDGFVTPTDGLSLLAESTVITIPSYSIGASQVSETVPETSGVTTPLQETEHLLSTVAVELESIHPIATSIDFDLRGLNRSSISIATKEYITAALINASESSDHTVVSITSEYMLPYLLHFLPTNLTAKAGYDISDVLMRCTYNGAPCKSSDFTRHIDASYGNCYTFNANGRHYTANKPGIAGGLSVTYSIVEDEYLDFIQASGARVVIQAQDVAIFPEMAGGNMPSGYHSMIAMKQVRANGLSSRSRPCVSNVSEAPDFDYVGVKYSTEACLKSCYQQRVIERCQCGDPRIPLPPGTNVGFCEVTRRDCVDESYSLDNIAMQRCYCPPPCTHELYEITQSRSKGSFADGEKEATDRHQHYTTRFNGGNGLAKIDVYFEDLTVPELLEFPAYDMFALLWELSSIAGLFLGISVMSVFEIINLIRYLWRRCRSDSNNCT